MNAVAQESDDFEAFCRGGHDRWVRRVAKKTMTVEDAEDIVQEAFIDLLKRWATAESPKA